MSTGSPPIAANAVESDGELARRVAAGDRAAAASLIERYERLVRSFLRKVTGRPDVADDLAQETFVRLLQHADRYDEQYPMRTWLLTIARRLSINFGRRMDQQVMSTEYEGRRAASDNPADMAAAADARQITRQRLDAALAQLSTAQREAMLLFHQQELSIEDVAQVMEIPVGTVKSHLHRARAALRKILAPQYEVIES
jgi:RNA polymerase sigma-70 factor (ECF subfamily)